MISLRTGLSLAALCATVGLLSGASVSGFVREIRAERIVIVDEFNREVGLLSGVNGARSWNCITWSKRTRPSCRPLKMRRSASCAQGKNRLRLLNRGRLSALEVRDDKGLVRILVGISDQEKPKVVLLARTLRPCGKPRHKSRSRPKHRPIEFQRIHLNQKHCAQSAPGSSVRKKIDRARTSRARSKGNPGTILPTHSHRPDSWELESGRLVRRFTGFREC